MPQDSALELREVDDKINEVVASLEMLSSAPYERQYPRNKRVEKKTKNFNQSKQVRAALRQTKTRAFAEDCELDQMLSQARLDLHEVPTSRSNERIINDIQANLQSNINAEETFRSSNMPGPCSVEQLLGKAKNTVSGTVTVKSFADLLRTSGVLLSAQEKESFIKLVDPNDTGVIKVDEFSGIVEQKSGLLSRALAGNPSRQNSSVRRSSNDSGSSSSPNNSSDAHAQTSVETKKIPHRELKRQKLREALESSEHKAAKRLVERGRSHALTMNTVMHHLGGVTAPLRRKLQQADSSNSGNLTAVELAAAFTAYGMPLEDGQIESLVNKYSVSDEHPQIASGRSALTAKEQHEPQDESIAKFNDKSRYRKHMQASIGAPKLVDYERMMNVLDEKQQEHEEETLKKCHLKRTEPPRVIQRAWRLIDRAGGVDNERWSRAFLSLDPSRSGTVASDALPVVLNSLGVRLTDKEMSTVLSIVDPTKTGRIEYDTVQANATRKVASLDLEKAERQNEENRSHRRGHNHTGTFTLAQLVCEEPGRTRAKTIAARTARRLKDFVEANGDEVAKVVSALQESERENNSSEANKGLSLQQLKTSLFDAGMNLSEQDVHRLADEATQTGTTTSGEEPVLTLEKFCKVHKIGPAQRPRVQFGSCLAQIGQASNDTCSMIYKTTTQSEVRNKRRLAGKGMFRPTESFKVSSMFQSNADGTQAYEALRPTVRIPTVSQDDLQMGSLTPRKTRARRSFSGGLRSTSVPPRFRSSAAYSSSATERLPDFMQHANPELRAYFERGRSRVEEYNRNIGAAGSASDEEQISVTPRPRRHSFRKVAPNGPQANNSHLVGGAAPRATVQQIGNSSLSAESSALTPRSRAFATLAQITNGASSMEGRNSTGTTPNASGSWMSLASLTGAGARSSSELPSRASSRAATPNLSEHGAASAPVSRSSTPRSDANHAPTPTHRLGGLRTTRSSGFFSSENQAAAAAPVKDTPPPAAVPVAPSPNAPQEP